MRKYFWKHLESLTCIPYHKICFKSDSTENFQVFKICMVFQVSIDQNCFLTDQKIQFLRLKVLAFFDSFRFSSLKIFFCLFLSQSFKSFLPQHLVRLFYPSFLFKLHAFMHFHQKFSNFWTKEILGFLMVLIQFVGWVFVHASYKHDSHALISKFSWFVQNFEIRVYVFLRNLGILFNYMELSKISLWYCLIE